MRSPAPPVFLLTLAAAVAAQIWFLRTGPAALAWDDAWYLETAFRLFDAARAGPAAFASAYASAFGFKAPLISVLPLPLFAVFGKTHIAALGVNTAALAALGIYSFLLGRRLFGTAAGAAAAFAVNTMPLIYGLSRVFFVELVLAALVAAWMHHLWASEGFCDPRHNAALGLLLGLGLLSKVLFPVFVTVPTLVYAWDRNVDGGLVAPGRRRHAAALILGLGGALAASWYAFNGNWLYTAGFALRASLGDIAAHYAASGSFLTARWAYLKSFTANGLSGYYAVAAPVLAAFWLGGGPGPRAQAWEAARDRRVRLLFSWILPPLALFVLQVNAEIRYAAPLLPAAAIALGALLERLTRRTPFQGTLIAVFFLLPIDLFAAQTFGRSLAPWAGGRAYNGPPRPAEDWNLAGVVSALERTRGEAPELMVAVAIEHRSFNLNTLACEAARLGLPIRFTHLGYAQSSVELAVIRLREKRADRLVTVAGVERGLPEAFNRVNAELQEKLDAGKIPFRPVASVPLRRGTDATIYTRY